MQRRCSRVAAGCAALAVLGLLVGCASSHAGPSAAADMSLYPAIGSPTASPGIPADRAVKKALGAVTDAQEALSADFGWLDAALGRQRVGDDPDKLLLWSAERKRIAVAKASARTAAQQARVAAKAVPRDCAAALAAKSRMYAEVHRAESAYAAFERLIRDARAAMSQAHRDRARLTVSLTALDRLVRAHPESTVNTVFERASVRVHSAREQQVLDGAVNKAESLGGVQINVAERVARDAGLIARPCYR